ncbi:hypothetical protein [Schaalia vaccimaxillae]|uniref:hypothetical protein n=1 Tax=Schaalia vaccimaxillae TaxID=183916 RepID=UPI0003B799DF|nr:hypothetical protein [Schaalia vaccimaxillae]
MHQHIENTSSTDDEPNIEVWNDLVSPRDLVISLAVSAVCAAAALIIAEFIGGQLLFWGLGGAVLGFIVNCFIVTPKRHVSIVDINEHGDPIDSTPQAEVKA